jgi:beta-glucosidase
VPRDDRWGRTYEGYGEDPSIVSPLGQAAVRGFQGASLGTNSVLATAKHYVGDGGTKFGTGSAGYLIDQGDAQISETELRAVHLQPYQSAGLRRVGSVMVSYSSWNGVKLHGDSYLINNVLKGELAFSGFVVSDWAGIKQLPDATYADQVAHAINAGIDMIMVPDDYVGTINAIVNGVNTGKIPQTRVRRCGHAHSEREVSGSICSTTHSPIARTRHRSARPPTGPWPGRRYVSRSSY